MAEDTSAPGKWKCVILAGGASRRFGGQDKALAMLDGRPLVSHVIERLNAADLDVAINTSDDGAYARFGLPLLADRVDGRPGPLAGVLTAMRWAAEQGAGQVFTTPADTPFLPGDLLERLAQPAAPIVMAGTTDGQVHHICARWSCDLAGDLERALVDEGTRAVWAYAAGHACETVVFPQRGGIDPFFNVNTPADLETASALMARGG